MPIIFGAIVVILILLLITSLKSFGINQEYQRGVLFRLGRLGITKGPARRLLSPLSAAARSPRRTSRRSAVASPSGVGLDGIG